jgi:hypothetical protein
MLWLPLIPGETGGYRTGLLSFDTFLESGISAGPVLWPMRVVSVSTVSLVSIGSVIGVPSLAIFFSTVCNVIFR